MCVYLWESISGAFYLIHAVIKAHLSFICLVGDTSHLWSFREPVISCTLLQGQETLGSLSLKSGKQAWTLVEVWSLQCDFCAILYSCHGSLASCSSDYLFILLFHLGIFVFFNNISESKILRRLCWMAAVIWKEKPEWNLPSFFFSKQEHKN